MPVDTLWRPAGGTLHMLGGPIGNLGDLTARGAEALRGSDAVYAEDTRVARVLLASAGSTRPLRSYREAADRNAVEGMIVEVIARLAAGEAVTYVSDAGTPGISDPGDLLCARVRAAGFLVDPLPGPSAVTALLSAAGLGVQHPLFYGFLPHKKGRVTALRELGALLAAGFVDGAVLFESPHRTEKLLDELRSIGVPLEAAVGRELTKRYGEVVSGTLEAVAYVLLKSRGEYVILIRHAR